MTVRQKTSRNKWIAELRSRGLSLEAIGQQYGLTRERVRQIVSQQAITRRFTTVSDLMTRFGVERYEVDRAMKVAGLSRKPRQGSRYVLSDADVAKITEILGRPEDRRCLICGRSFEGRVHRSRRFCSPECFHQYQRQNRQSGLRNNAMSATTRQIQELLAAEPPGSTWLGFLEAVRVSGMTRMQMCWLRYRRLIACKPRKEKGRSGKPQMLYSARHCEALRRFLERGAGAGSG
jgi:hypothetical protein